ncbi:MAG TPA: ketoacyl-ACP synthase III [Holophagaceae bacterium]|jgi:3-oxoacyl-[acyl-carrier-protein] synthase-3|nr:ketoacyl-ACP synthase III [Holophagaceae bacterium]
MALRTVIVGSGSVLPLVVVPNAAFLQHDFRGLDGAPIGKPNEEILTQFEAITGIRERRYAAADQVTSDLALEAARNALASSGIDPETLEGILVAHNFGDVRLGSTRSDLVPSLAARVKASLGIRNPACAAFDLVFGCPGWLQSVIQADAMIRSGQARRVLVIGADTLSRVSDPHDRDSLIYADGAGAVILEGHETEGGILASAARTDAVDGAALLTMGPSSKPGAFPGDLFLKMEGRKLYRYALNQVPLAMKAALERAGVGLAAVSKILIHQANWKMDEAIVDALYATEGLTTPPDIMPMTIAWLGNSSVATVPTLWDLMIKDQFEGQALHSGDLVLFASVGAGMHINAVVYRMPVRR